MLHHDRGDYTYVASLPPRSRPFFRHAAAVGGLFAGLSDAGFGAAPLCRGVVCAHQVGASTSTALTVRLERGWCPLCALSALARDFRPWQAVAAVGVEVHLWRVEVRLRRQLLVHIQPRPASLRAAPHRLCPAACRRQLLHCWQLHIPHTALRSTCCCTDPRGRPPSPPWPAPRWRASPRRSATRSWPSLCCSRSARCCHWCCRPLRGGVELHGGGPGIRGGAVRRQLSSGGSGAPPARLQRLFRDCAARSRDPCVAGAMRKKCGCFGALFALWRAL